MLVLYCVNLQFMKPLAYDRGQELAYLQMKDRELMAQKASLERTTEGLMQQKEQLLQHYKETESVGRKLEIYKEKLRADAQEVKDAEAAAEVLMQRLATAQGKTISAQQQLSDEKAKLATAKKEIDKVRADEKALKRDEKTDKLVRALQHAEMKDEVPAKERADLCHDCTCVKYC
jgi:chromosome segregation ATPase